MILPPPFLILVVHWKSTGCFFSPTHRLFVFFSLCLFVFLLSQLIFHSSCQFNLVHWNSDASLPSPVYSRFGGDSVLRNRSQIWEFWQFSTNPHTPRMCGKLPNLPNIASVSQNKGMRKITVFFHIFGFFFLRLPWTIFQGVCVSKMYFGRKLPKL